MKTPFNEAYKTGARDAWLHLNDLGYTCHAGLMEGRRKDHYDDGWNEQLSNPDTELHPPDFPEPPDYSLHRGLCTGVAVTGLAACIGAGVKYGVANPFTWLLAIVALLLLVRASRIPA